MRPYHHPVLANANTARGDGSENGFKRVTYGTTLVAVTIESIVDSAITRVFPEPALPPNDDLGKQIGVSRHVVREAVNQLVALGILDPRANLGTRIVDERQWKIVNPDVVRWRQIRGTDPELPGDVVEMRRWIEPFVAANAARHATDDARARVVAACETRLARPSRQLYLAACRELHAAVFAACDNQIARQFDCFVGQPTRPASFVDGPVVDVPAEELHAVMALADAFNAHQPDAAHAAMVDLLNWDLMPMEMRDA